MKLIAIWGNSGAGKTAVSLALAAALSERKRDVLILSSDLRTPTLPVLLPTVKELDDRCSIGPLLARAEWTESSLKGRLLRHPKNGHIYCMGTASGEATAISYPPATHAGAVGLLRLLNSTPFSYVLVDCDPSPIFDQLTLAALELAHTGLMLLTPDIKGYEFRKAQQRWMGNNDAFHLERFFTVASPICAYTPIREARALFGGFDGELPDAPEVAERMLAGELLTGFAKTSGVRFGQQIRALAERLEERGTQDG